MLVLSRRQGERIIIGADISVRVVSIFGGRVKLCVAAPKNVSVNREEVELKIKCQESKMASNDTQKECLPTSKAILTVTDKKPQVSIELEFRGEDADGPGLDFHVHQLMICVAKSLSEILGGDVSIT
ncbi:MAG: carbon storage regulator [Candidatus Azotimanducaceae bacterium]|jgi:carbon storage regulator